MKRHPEGTRLKEKGAQEWQKQGQSQLSRHQETL